MSHREINEHELKELFVVRTLWIINFIVKESQRKRSLKCANCSISWILNESRC